MKLIKENLNKYIDLYLNDVEDYGEDTEFLLAESVLSPIKKLLTESKNDGNQILESQLKKASTYEKEIIEDFLAMIKENPELKNKILKDDDKTKLMCLSGVKQYPMRVKCATLSWHTLVSAMQNDGKQISTEE